ncbi:hypothetical protein VNO77_42602 [Canavalia gladiata]|uniref:Uncharacterized protein n=1 Tax=Canavalia gladiata TaxID=3824 RepID=A0AAN9PM74_CANGL
MTFKYRPIIATLLLCSLLSFSQKIPHSASITNTASTHTSLFFFTLFIATRFLFNLLDTHLVLGAQGPSYCIPEALLSLPFKL